MKNALYLLLKLGYHILFIIFEVICFYFIVSYNQNQKDIFINSTNIFTSAINKHVDKVENYLNLQIKNDSLHAENARLQKKLLQLKLLSKTVDLDTIFKDSFQFEVIPVDICNKSINQRYNYLTLCKGTNSGITKDMGVVSENGLVGIVRRTTDNYSDVLSILHPQTNISCAIKRNKSHGSLVWKDSNPRIMHLEDIPKHLSVIEGDTVITSGYSTIFPKGIEVGKVKKVFLKNGSNSFTIEVQLFNDPSVWDVVYVLKNNQIEERKQFDSKDE